MSLKLSSVVSTYESGAWRSMQTCGERVEERREGKGMRREKGTGGISRKSRAPKCFHLADVGPLPLLGRQSGQELRGRHIFGRKIQRCVLVLFVCV